MDCRFDQPPPPLPVTVSVILAAPELWSEKPQILVVVAWVQVSVLVLVKLPLLAPSVQ